MYEIYTKTPHQVIFIQLIHSKSSLLWSNIDKKNWVFSEQNFSFVKTCFYRVAFLL